MDFFGQVEDVCKKVKSGEMRPLEGIGEIERLLLLETSEDEDDNE